MSKGLHTLTCLSTAIVLLTSCMPPQVPGGNPGIPQHARQDAAAVTEQLIKAKQDNEASHNRSTPPERRAVEQNLHAPGSNSSSPQPLTLPQAQAQAAQTLPPSLSQKPQEKKRSTPIEKPSRTAAQQNSIKKRLTLAQLVKKYPDLLLLHGPSGSNKVALTFDDAPDTKYTPQVLDILKKYNVKATFFVVGRLVEQHPAVVKRMTREGHIVGNHTYNHALLTRLSDEQFQIQINKTQNLIKTTIGYKPKLIRPPYGEITESQLLWASNHQMTIVNWNVDSKDWKQLNQAQVTANVLNHTKSGSIILQHSGGGPDQNLSGTVAALPTIIESLQSQGYQLVTLPELLKVSKQL